MTAETTAAPTREAAAACVEKSEKVQEEGWFNWGDGKMQVGEAIACGVAAFAVLSILGKFGGMFSWIEWLGKGLLLYLGGKGLMKGLSGTDFGNWLADLADQLPDWVKGPLKAIGLFPEKGPAVTTKRKGNETAYTTGAQRERKEKEGTTTASAVLYAEKGPEPSYDGQLPVLDENGEVCLNEKGQPLYTQGVKLSFVPMAMDQKPIGTVEYIVNGKKQERNVYEVFVQAEPDPDILAANMYNLAHVLPSALSMSNKPNYEGQEPCWIDKEGKKYYAGIGTVRAYVDQRPCYIDPKTGTPYYQQCVKLSKTPAYKGQEPFFTERGEKRYEVPDQDVSRIASLPGAKMVIGHASWRGTSYLANRKIAMICAEEAAERALRKKVEGETVEEMVQEATKAALRKKAEEELGKEAIEAAQKKAIEAAKKEAIEAAMKKAREQAWEKEGIVLSREAQERIKKEAIEEFEKNSQKQIAKEAEEKFIEKNLTKKAQQQAAKQAEQGVVEKLAKEAAEKGAKDALEKAGGKGVSGAAEKIAEKAVQKVANKGAAKVATQGVVKVGAKKAWGWIGKGVLKIVAKVPVVSAVVGLGFAGWRYASNKAKEAAGEEVDWERENAKGWAEVTSGAVACIPYVGTVASIGIDATVAWADVSDEMKKNTAEEEVVGPVNYSRSPIHA